MPDVICNTSPFQYLHRIGQLELLPRLVSRVIVPTAVAQELAEGRRRGLDLPIPEELAWVDLRAPASERVVRLVADLGPGETGVLLLALERTDPVVILDDALARRHAEALGIALTGTLGILLDGKGRASRHLPGAIPPRPLTAQAPPGSNRGGDPFRQATGLCAGRHDPCGI